MARMFNRSSSIKMNRMSSNPAPASPAWVVVCILLLFSWVLRATAADPVDVTKLPLPDQRPVDFTRDIRPILENSCLRCHGPEKPKSHFRLDNSEDALKGGNNGVDLIPGDSAKSPFIRYVARLVPDLEMPPTGKGEPLTPAQIGLLRGWIDQGLPWDKSSQTNSFAVSLSPTFGGTAVSGNVQKFRELNWQPAGLNGGLEQFEMSGTISPHTKYDFSGRLLRDDYKLNYALDRNDLGFIHAGWDQFRKYYSDTGGFFPSLNPSAPDDGRDLYLDIGKAWIDFGLNLPHWPQMKLGYEYDYKQGDESIINWGLYKPGNLRAIAPAADHLDEEQHVIKFDLDHEIAGMTIEERFRGEFYSLGTQYTNRDVRGASPMENASEGNSYFQGANTIRLERKFNEWFFGSGGYLYSKLNSDASFTDSVNNNTLLYDSIPRITLEKQSHVFNLNGLLGPFSGLTLSVGVQADWTGEHGFSGNKTLLNPAYTNGISVAPVTVDVVPTALSSDYDQSTVTENMALRYSKIPYTSLFVEAKLQQETIGQFDEDFQPASGFMQNTSFFSQLSDVRAGFNSSPWRDFSLSGQYRRYQNDSHYNNDPGLLPPASYPGFIRARDLLTDEVDAKLSWRPSSWLKTALSYKYQTTRSWMDTDPISGGISPGGGIAAGEYYSQIYSFNSTMTPCRRLFFSTTFSYQPSTSITADNGIPEVAAYRGQTCSVFANSTYVLSKDSDVFATYSFSDADYAQNNYAAGLPVGLEYQQNAVQAGWRHRFGKATTLQLKYAFYNYVEPSSGGVNNYVANSVFATLTYRWP